MTKGPTKLPSWVRIAAAAFIARKTALRANATFKKLCIYKVDRLGDFILATGAIHQLLDRHGAEQCHLIVSTAAAALAKNEFPDLSLTVVPPDQSSLFREVVPTRQRLAKVFSEMHFSSLICLRHGRSLYRDVVLSLIHAKEWHGLEDRPSGWRLEPANRPVFPATYHLPVDRPWNRDLLAHRKVLAGFLGCDLSWPQIRPAIRHVDLSPGEDIVISPFASDHIRDYPMEKWESVWAGIDARRRCVVVAGPSPRLPELKRLCEIVETGSGATTRIVTELPGTGFIDLIARARLVVGVESAVAHIAAAFDRPSILLTGGGHWEDFAPWGDSDRQTWLTHQLPCFGCRWLCIRNSPECITHIPVSLVKEKLAELLVATRN